MFSFKPHTFLVKKQHLAGVLQPSQIKMRISSNPEGASAGKLAQFAGIIVVAVLSQVAPES